MVKQTLCWYFWVPRPPICHCVTGGRRRKAKNSKSRVQYSLKFVEDDQETSCGCDRGVLVGMAGGCVNFPKSKISKKFKTPKFKKFQKSKNKTTFYVRCLFGGCGRGVIGCGIGHGKWVCQFSEFSKIQKFKKKHMSPKSILYVRCLIVFSCIKSGYLLGDSRKGQHKK